jgi:ATP-binding cassette subfamily C protein CydC
VYFPEVHIVAISPAQADAPAGLRGATSAQTIQRGTADRLAAPTRAEDGHAAARRSAGAASAIAPPQAAGALRLRGVRFTYPGRTSGVDLPELDLAAGGCLLVGGASGAGKSTLAALLARLMDPNAGQIELDGCDLRHYDEATLRRRVVLQTQRPHLFAASLAQNLRVADPGADDARLRAVLVAVALDDWLQRLPQGLDTMIGEYGLGLSGGEARRVALARTLLRPACLFVLDEPFEGLDAQTQAAVVAGLEAWTAAASLVVISHQSAAFARPCHQLKLTPRPG